MKQQQNQQRTLIQQVIIFLLLQKSMRPEDDLALDDKIEDDESEFSRIRCPQCQWQPHASSRWYCADNSFPELFFDGCGRMWNTFATRGLCPGCAHQWRWTSCLQCGQWSLHEDWYEKKTEE